MSALKNLSSLKRSITKRLREALQELQENLGNIGNLERQPIPVRIPVPNRGGAPFKGRNPLNFFQQHGKFPAMGVFQSPVHRGLGPSGRMSAFQVQTSRFFSTYNRYGGFNSWRWARINQSVIFQNFSSKSQFRSKSFHRFYRAPTLTQLLKKKSGLFDENLPSSKRTISAATVPRSSTVSTALRLNASLTQKFHDLVLDLAKPVAPESSNIGCYVDFKLEPKLLIPSATIMSAEVLKELLANLKRFEQHVADLQRDLSRLSELGELPLKFIAADGIIRVYFPNCDRPQLEGLLVEKNVMGGVIHEDHTSPEQQLCDDGSVTSVSEFDILSSCNSMSSASSGSADQEDFDDILSSSAASSNEKIVHLEPVVLSGHVAIADEYYWA